MTENEVLKDLQNYQGILKAKTRINASANPEIALNAITEAIEVIQQYRAIGTVEELQQLKEYIDTINEICSGYSAIGTIEEFKALKEKECPKKPKHSETYGKDYYYCPTCGCGVTIIMEHGCESDYELDRCEQCGQAIDWSEKGGAE